MATLAADSMISGGELYSASTPARYLYPVVKQCVMMMLISPVQGYLNNSVKDTIADMTLPSVIDVLTHAEKGSYLVQTIDLATLAGTVMMAHESLDQVNADIQKIRDAEGNLALYRVEPTADLVSVDK